MTPKPPTCPTCNTPGIRVERWDAYACTRCNAWLERQCTDARCWYCPRRPVRPRYDHLDALGGVTMKPFVPPKEPDPFAGTQWDLCEHEHTRGTCTVCNLRKVKERKP